MEQAICDYVKTCAEPDFFHHADDPSLQQAHEEIRRSIEEATETITIMMDIRLIQRAEKVFASIGWTVEEALILFLNWCMECPEQLTAWEKSTESRVKYLFLAQASRLYKKTCLIHTPKHAETQLIITTDVKQYKFLI